MTSATCFLPGTSLPEARETLAQADHGQAGREVMAAAFSGDHAALARLLAADPRLRTTHAGETELLRVAIARCDKPLVDLLLGAGVAPNGTPGTYNPPLAIALRATEPWYAERLLKAGASAVELHADGFVPLHEALAIGSGGAVQLLLDHGADVNRRDALGGSPLQTAVDMQRFDMAELLVARGANIWAVDQTGGTLGSGLIQESVMPYPAAEAARLRLLARLRDARWPQPVPGAQAMRKLVLAGHWPPPGVHSKLPVIPPAALAAMRHLYQPDGRPRP